MCAADYPLMADFLYHAIFQPEGGARLPHEVIFQPEIFVYIDGFGVSGAPGDIGVVAEGEGGPLGMAWTRIIPGYGHIDADTPELAVSVLPSHRGAGIGTALLTGLFDLLRARGYRQTSLSVQTKNPAARLYQRVGYEIVADRGEDWLMVKQL
jgi:ribosomal protein S18 acetylase RimI-like enzyme